ncbi:MAG: hypothetical protein AAGF95_10500 [Chloroflexota bacterium]
MSIPRLTSQHDLLRYYHDQGHLQILDWRRLPNENVFVDYTDIETIGQAFDAIAMLPQAPTACIAGYALAMVARAWQQRPSEPRRAAIIQAAAQLRMIAPPDTHQLLEQALTQADTAITHGQNAETAIVEFIDEKIRQSDKIAERCGRRAAELLDDGDNILTHGFGGTALNWILHIAHNTQNKQITLYTTEAQPYGHGTYLMLPVAQAMDIKTELLKDDAVDEFLSQTTIHFCILAAQQIALDGSIAASAGASQITALARQHNVPCYVLGYGGPDPDMQTSTVEEDRQALFDMIPAERISAIITDRGTYRPAMISRYLNDGDAPLDVIPLQ